MFGRCVRLQLVNGITVVSFTKLIPNAMIILWWAINAFQDLPSHCVVLFLIHQRFWVQAGVSYSSGTESSVIREANGLEITLIKRIRYLRESGRMPSTLFDVPEHLGY